MFQGFNFRSIGSIEVAPKKEQMAGCNGIGWSDSFFESLYAFLELHIRPLKYLPIYMIKLPHNHLGNDGHPHHDPVLVYRKLDFSMTFSVRLEFSWPYSGNRMN